MTFRKRGTAFSVLFRFQNSGCVQISGGTSKLVLKHIVAAHRARCVGSDCSAVCSYSMEVRREALAGC